MLAAEAAVQASTKLLKCWNVKWLSQQLYADKWYGKTEDNN